MRTIERKARAWPLVVSRTGALHFPFSPDHDVTVPHAQATVLPTSHTNDTCLAVIAMK